MTHDANALPPPAALINLLSGKFITHALGAAAELGLADQLRSGPRSAAELAQAAGADADAVYRLARALTTVGVFVEHEERRFSLTDVGALLARDTPGSLREMAIFWGQDWHSAAWGKTVHSVKTGASGFVAAHDASPWAFLAQHPEAGAVFNAAMGSFSRIAAEAVVAAYDFSRFTRIADIGGGHGALLAGILQTTRASGLLFDRPEVIAGAREAIADPALASRIETVAGDFFASIPEGCDAYVLKNVIHDWGDDEAATILTNCARGLAADGRVLLVEMVVSPANVPDFAKIIDLEMLVVAGGKERTEAEYRALLARAGLELLQILPTQSPIQIIEAARR